MMVRPYLRLLSLATFAFVMSLPACGSEPIAHASALHDDGIVGGVPFTDMPAIGAIYVDGEFTCTGTLITRRKVLTAAHCLEDLEPEQVSFRIGHDVQQPTTTIAATRLALHPNYDRYTLKHDIAYVILRSNAPVAAMRRLFAMDQDYIGVELLFVGYGQSHADADTEPPQKRATWMPVLALDETRFAYAAAGKNTCYGDSGGPALAYDEASDSYAIAGITSWGDVQCAEFGVNTRVDVYRSFLDS